MAEKRYGKIADERSREVIVGVGVDEQYYASIGMTLMDVEQAWNGNWYIAGYAPDKPQPTVEEQVAMLEGRYNLPRAARTALLALRAQGTELDTVLMARVDEIEALAIPLREGGSV